MVGQYRYAAGNRGIEQSLHQPLTLVDSTLCMDHGHWTFMRVLVLEPPRVMTGHFAAYRMHGAFYGGDNFVPLVADLG